MTNANELRKLREVAKQLKGQVEKNKTTSKVNKVKQKQAALHLNKNMECNGEIMRQLDMHIIDLLKPVVRKVNGKLVYYKNETINQWNSRINKIYVLSEVMIISSMIGLIPFLKKSLNTRVGRNSEVAHLHARQNNGHKIALQVARDRLNYLRSIVPNPLRLNYN